MSLLSGWLLKRTKKGKWRARFFEMHSHYLLYQARRVGSTRGGVDLRGVDSSVESVEIAASSGGGAAGPCLRVRGLDAQAGTGEFNRPVRTLDLRADNDPSRDSHSLEEWERALCAAQAALRAEDGVGAPHGATRSPSVVALVSHWESGALDSGAAATGGGSRSVVKSPPSPPPAPPPAPPKGRRSAAHAASPAAASAPSAPKPKPPPRAPPLPPPAPPAGKAPSPPPARAPSATRAPSGRATDAAGAGAIAPARSAARAPRRRRSIFAVQHDVGGGADAKRAAAASSPAPPRSDAGVGAAAAPGALRTVRLRCIDPHGEPFEVDVDDSMDVAALKNVLASATGHNAANVALALRRAAGAAPRRARTARRSLGTVRFDAPDAAAEAAAAHVAADGCGVIDALSGEAFSGADGWMSSIDGRSAAVGEAETDDAFDGEAQRAARGGRGAAVANGGGGSDDSDNSDDSDDMGERAGPSAPVAPPNLARLRSTLQKSYRAEGAE